VGHADADAGGAARVLGRGLDRLGGLVLGVAAEIADHAMLLRRSSACSTSSRQRDVLDSSVAISRP